MSLLITVTTHPLESWRRCMYIQHHIKLFKWMATSIPLKVMEIHLASQGIEWSAVPWNNVIGGSCVATCRKTELRTTASGEKYNKESFPSIILHQFHTPTHWMQLAGQLWNWPQDRTKELVCDFQLLPSAWLQLGSLLSPSHLRVVTRLGKCMQRWFSTTN